MPLFPLEPHERTSLALRRAPRALRQLSEAPAFVPTVSAADGPDEGEGKPPGTSENGTN